MLHDPFRGSHRTLRQLRLCNPQEPRNVGTCSSGQVGACGLGGKWVAEQPAGSGFGGPALLPLVWGRSTAASRWGTLLSC